MRTVTQKRKNFNDTDTKSIDPNGLAKEMRQEESNQSRRVTKSGRQHRSARCHCHAVLLGCPPFAALLPVLCRAGVQPCGVGATGGRGAGPLVAAGICCWRHRVLGALSTLAMESETGKLKPENNTSNMLHFLFLFSILFSLSHFQ